MKQRIRTLIVDDESAARRGLRLLLKNDEDIDIVAECRNGPEAVAAIKKEIPDLLFLDVQMPGMDGFEVLSKVDAKCLPGVVFVTAYNSYAVRAFEAHALDYLLKPFTNDRFRATLERVKGHMKRCEMAALADRLAGFLAERDAADNNSAALPDHEYMERVPVRSGERVLLLDVAAIDWIEANDDYVVLHAGHENHQVSMRMKDIEEKLNPRMFARIHRSAIVNVACVRELQPYFHGDFVVVMRDGTKLRLSRRRRHQFEQLLGMPL